ncbi:MAG: glutaminase A, partial [Rubrivivax sp.]
MPDTATGHAATSPILAYLQQLHARFRDDKRGQVATYIPELAKADPAWFGITIATVDGQVYEVGTTRQPFTIQSISKPLVYGIALEDRGVETVQRTVGVEPSGEAFNAISLEAGTGRPMNPMINAGAIATASLVAGDTPAARLARVVDAISAYAGRPLDIDETVFASERDTGHRNRAIGHMLRNYGIIGDDPEPALDLYFRQCSLLVDGRDLALMAATLANGGIHPLTGARAVAAEHVGPILSVMTTCGVYDLTGEWVYHVGMPAKSGVGGGIIAVLPGQLGIGVFSPALDERGNSVRGVEVCKALSRELGLHFLQPPQAAPSTVRARYSLATMRSKRRRSTAEQALLDQTGAAAAVWELQGDLRFATLEPVLRDIAAAGDTLLCVVLDFKRVTRADDAATRMLAALVAGGAPRGLRVVLT